MSDYRRRKILLIESDPRDVKWLSRMLRSEKTNAVLAVDEVNTALKLCGKHHIDCILLDLSLPGVDGMRFMSQLKKLAGYSNGPVIMLTGQGVEISAAEARRLGTKYYLSKTLVSQEKLLRTVGNVSSHGAAARKREGQLSKLEEYNQQLLKKLDEIDLRLNMTESRLQAFGSTLDNSLTTENLKSA